MRVADFSKMYKSSPQSFLSCNNDKKKQWTKKGKKRFLRFLLDSRTKVLSVIISKVDSPPGRHGDESLETCGDNSHHLTADAEVPDRCSLKPQSRRFDHQCKLAFIWPSPLISACHSFFSPSAPLGPVLFIGASVWSEAPSSVFFFMSVAKKKRRTFERIDGAALFFFFFFLNGAVGPACHCPPAPFITCCFHRSAAAKAAERPRVPLLS